MPFAAYSAHNLPTGLEPGLEETSFYDPANFTFPNSAHIAQVEIDPETGEVALQRYIAVDDVGKVINPMIVEGQIRAASCRGSARRYGSRASTTRAGSSSPGSLMEYAMPRAEAFPRFEIGRIETPSPHNPLGVKGAGEMGTIAGTVTLANAVMDALAPLGIRHLDMPLTPEKIWQAMSRSGKDGQRSSTSGENEHVRIEFRIPPTQEPERGHPAPARRRRT